MKQFKIFTIAMLMLGLFSCKKDIIGEGPITTETRTVGTFTGIELQMNGNVYYRVAPEFKIEISARESIHDMLETKVVNGTLVVRYYDGKTYDNDESIRITVSGPAVDRFVTNSSGNINATNDINVANLYMRSSHSGNITLLNVTALSIEAESKQSGKVAAGVGTANTANLRTEGSGTVDLRYIEVKYAIAKLRGSNDIRVRVSEKLDVTVYGSGWMIYYGRPVVDGSVLGTGKIVREG
jgi:hypothetical protein